MKNMIAPSMMCVDYSKVKETLDIFEETGVDYLHMDVMDGEFVPNIALGTDFCKQVRKMCGIPLDIHLMITRPDSKLDYFDIHENDIVSVHYESTPHIHRLLSRIREKGAKAFVALCPGTPVSVLENIIDIIDGVLIMTVNPGFSGQKIIPSCLDKVVAAKKLFEEKGYTDKIIEVDGNIGFENSRKIKELGANMFVGGTSSAFFKGDIIQNNIKNFQEAVR